VAALAAAVSVLLAGCGAGSLSASQLRTAAARICAVAQRRTERIPTPTLPSQATTYLSRGIDALTPEVTGLRRLHPPSELAREYRTALDATTDELGALRVTVNGLRAGNDSVTAFTTLQRKLTPLETRSNGAWASLELTGCASR
jgi:hypothetical protein